MKTRVSKDKRVFSELSNEISRKIIFSIVKNAKSGKDIARDTKLSLSTVYQKIIILLDLGMVYEERQETTSKGRKIWFYKSRISKAKILIGSDTPTIKLIRN